MAFTITEVTTPNSRTTEGSLLGMRAKIVQLTPDASYDNTNGEVLTAAEVGWRLFIGAIILRHPYAAGTKLGMTTIPIPNASGSQLAFFMQRYDGAAVDKASLEDAANAFDASTYIMRVLLLGY